MKIAVVYGSVREARQGIKLAKFVVKKLEERKHEVTFVDPLKYSLPLLNKRYFEFPKGKAPKVMKGLHKIFAETDGIIIVSGEYNHGFPSPLKNLLDHFYDEYKRKVAGIVTYSGGPFAGIRVIPSWRETLSEFGMIVAPKPFMVSMVQDSFDERGNAINKDYEKRIKEFLDEFEWLLEKIKKE